MSEVYAKGLGDIIRLKRGYDLPASERTEGVYPVISSSGISGTHCKFKVEGPGVVTGRYGTLGEVYYTENNFWPHNTALYVEDFQSNSPMYIYYLLKCLGHIKTSDKSAVPGVNRNELHAMSVPYVGDLPEQEKLASTLWEIDKKIELNSQVNAELEAVAKLIYDYWFVQFDFPITAEQAAAMGKPEMEGRPYKSSGGKMVFDSVLKREIPERWKVSAIGKVFKTHLGGTPSRSVVEYWSPPEISWLSSGDKETMFVLKGDESISEEGLKNSAAKLLPPGTIILSIVRHIRASILGKEAATNQSVVGIEETEAIKHDFIYPFIQREIPRYMQLRTGAQQPHINKAIVDKTIFAIPDKVTLSKYSGIATPLFEKIRVNHEQNQELASLRDWLLPMLMNGQVKVG